MYVAPSADTKDGDFVRQGDIIGKTVDISGSYNNTAQHVHVEYREKNKALPKVNPRKDRARDIVPILFPRKSGVER